MSKLQFRRRLNSLTYSYLPCEPRNERPAWKREDLDLWLAWSPSHGWAGLDSNNQILSIPWGLALAEQGDEPPLGVWVSRKADKSYVYDLVQI